MDKVATLASPFRGSFESVIKITTGTADLGDPEASSREREAARLTPALYHLLPSFDSRLIVDNGDLEPTETPIRSVSPAVLFNPEVWQPNIIATIKHYIDLHGLGETDSSIQARNLFADLDAIGSGSMICR